MTRLSQSLCAVRAGGTGSFGKDCLATHPTDRPVPIPSKHRAWADHCLLEQVLSSSPSEAAERHAGSSRTRGMRGCKALGPHHANAANAPACISLHRNGHPGHLSTSSRGHACRNPYRDHTGHTAKAAWRFLPPCHCNSRPQMRTRPVSSLLLEYLILCAALALPFVSDASRRSSVAVACELNTIDISNHVTDCPSNHRLWQPRSRRCGRPVPRPKCKGRPGTDADFLPWNETWCRVSPPAPGREA